MSVYDSKFMKNSQAQFKSAFSKENLGGTIGTGLGAVGQIAGTAVDLAQTADTSNIENNINNQSSFVSQANTNEDLLAEFANRTHLDNVTYEQARGLSGGDIAGGIIGAGATGASAGAQMGGGLGAVIGGGIGLLTSGIGAIVGSVKARDKQDELNRKVAAANTRNLATLQDKAAALDTQSDLALLANYSADGGPIHIAPSKRGTFTRAAKERGLGVQEFANRVLANKDNYSTAMIKKANFAKNAAKWHDEGGSLNSLFTNGITQINNGGSHESNPHQGIQLGVDTQGIPNLVEEGEVIWNDYVFSDRLKVPKKLQDKYKLKDMTFAEAAKKLQKESEERPNDPISKNGLEALLIPLQEAQEFIRMKKEINNLNKQYAHGGKLGNLFDGLGKQPNTLRRDMGIVETGGIYPDFLQTLSNEDTSFVPQITYSNYVEQFPQPAIIPSASIDNYYQVSSGDNSNVTPLKPINQGASWLRYAPAVGSAIGTLQSLVSQPDYSNAKAIEDAAQLAGNYQPVGFSPINRYLQYTPFDRNYYTNKLQAESAATRRALANSSGVSRNAALLAADFNAQSKLGELFRQAEEYNLAQKQKIEEFNRSTDMTNTELGLRAATANQSARQAALNARLQGITNAASMREAIDSARAQSISSNLSNLFTNIGNIGIDDANRADKKFYLKHVGSNLPLDYYALEFGVDDAKAEAARRGYNAEDINTLFSNYNKLKKSKKSK